MASSVKVIGDLGSEEFRLVRLQLNALLDSIAAATTLADVQTDLTNGLVKKVVESHELPAPPQLP